MATSDDQVVLAGSGGEDAELVVPGSDEGSEADIRVIKGYRKRTAEIRFRGDYDGLWVKVWINCPRKLIKRLASDDADAVDRALTEFIDDHNLRYEDGTPLGKPLTLKDVGNIDNVLYSKIVRLGVEAMQQAAGVPKN